MVKVEIPIRDGHLLLALAQAEDEHVQLVRCGGDQRGQTDIHLITYTYSLWQVNGLNVFVLSCLAINTITDKSKSTQYVVCGSETEATDLMVMLATAAQRMLKYRPSQPELLPMA